MTTTLTSQERVRRMFARQDHDRVPRHDSFWPETLERWKTEGLIGWEREVLDLLESDFACVDWLWPVPFPGTEQVLEETADTKVVRDAHGQLVRYWRFKSGTPEHLGFDCDTREKWETVYKPALLAKGLQVDVPAAVRDYRRGRENGKWTYLAGVETFEQARKTLGDEYTMMAMAEDPEWIRDVSRTYTDIMLMNQDAVMATGIQPDCLWIYGDMAFKTATFCSPAMYRELIWPDHKRLADWAHAHRMKFIYHTDGDVNGVIPMYIEAGFDCFHPIESKANMDIRNLCPKYGDKLAFFGNIDVMIMKDNDLERLEEEIVSKFAAGMQKKGYVYHSDHSVPPQVTWKTYLAIIELVKKHGKYPT